MSRHTSTPKQQPAMKELTLLLMGETGVGKSTFVNSIVNVLTFQSLADAEKSKELVSLIPSSFTITDGDLKKETIVTRGIDMDNEKTTVGRSATQSARIYRIVTDYMILQLIDTAGIGEGLEKDQRNMEDILETIAQLDRLDGIMILLKPNNSRIGVVFRYCVNELLMQLHKSAAANIVFSFTNTRATFYRPGDTLPGLQELLEENPDFGIPINKDRIYCFDSEFFRYLAAIRNNISISEELKTGFYKSWDKFAFESKRLLNHISSISPHDVRNTTSMNNVRQAVIRMIKPLSELMQMMEKKILDLKQKWEEIEELRESGRQLSNSRHTVIEKLCMRFHGRELYACRHPDCKQSFTHFGKKQKRDKRCHEVRLRRSFHWNCFSVSIHTMITESLLTTGIQTSETSVNPDVEAQLSNYKASAERKVIVIQAIEKQIKECKAEYKFVQKAAATFALFLKLNAILPFTDTRIEYLDHMIEEEKAKSFITGNDFAVKKLMKTKEEYMREFQVMEKAMASGEGMGVKDPQKMQEIESKLCSLNYFGKNIQPLEGIRDEEI